MYREALEIPVHELLAVRDDIRTVLAETTTADKNAFLESVNSGGDQLAAAALMHGELTALAGGLSKLITRKEGRTDSGSRFNFSMSDIPGGELLETFSDQVFSIHELSTYFDVSPGNHMELVRKLEKHFIHSAHKAAEELPESYRKRVGCRGVYVDEANENYAILSSGNKKLHELSPKYCAERANLEHANAHGYKRAIVLVVFGEPQMDDDSGVESPTLHPCAQCREELATNPLVDDETLIICAAPDGQQQEFLINELLEIHGINL